MRVILVGGFLGAGKTSLLWECARRLTERGIAVGLITNDQAPDLVDTALLSGSGLGVREVAGSCFCCNFGGLLGAVRSLEEAGADCILAEPVGSCTDLRATIVRPLADLYPAYGVAPLTVLVDPLRVREALRERNPLLHADAVYIMRVQLEEADCILLNKVDTISEEDRVEIVSYLEREFPHAPVTGISARTGEGIDAWLEGALQDGPAGLRVVDVDYDRYANGEAVLGWLNAVVGLRWTSSLEADWMGFVKGLLEALQRELRERQCEVGHIKMLLETAQGQIAANLTSTNEDAQVQTSGELGRLSAVLTVNARVQVSPEGIEGLFREALRGACYGRAAATMRAVHCLSPGRPEPTHRYGAEGSRG